MSRLIDADECPCILCNDTRNAHCTYEHRSCALFCNWLNDTVYDIEKVVAEMEDYRKGAQISMEAIGQTIGLVCMDTSFMKAIEIVRKGGIDG